MSPPSPIPAYVREANGRRARARDAVAMEPSPACIEVSSGDAVVRQLKTSERVARDIVNDVIEQGLGTGDSLPSEAEMLSQYGVSRESLREGLRLLEVQGLITLRRGPGGGPIVGTVDPANLGRTSTLYYQLSGGIYAELFEAWIFAEGELAERAARHPDGARRSEVVGPFSAAFDPSGHDTVEEYIKSHTRFHGAVASLVRNRVLEVSLQTYGQIVSHHVMVVDDPRHLGPQIHDDHHEIADAIVAGHPRQARQLMETHIAHVIEYSQRRFGDRIHDLIDWQ
jgi:GntR family transcriptional repressor for pyruvate dehydrogenase complex